MNLNKIFILGRLTRDPEMRQTQSGQTIVNLSLATNRMWNDQAGVKQNQTEFHNVVIWGKLGQIAHQYLAKARLVLIEGRISTRSWQDQSGQKRNRTEIIAENMQMGPRMLSGSQAPDSGANTAPPANQKPPEPALPEVQFDDFGGDEKTEEVRIEDIPF